MPSHVVFVTKVNPEYSERYKSWLSKMQKKERTYRGFQSNRVSAPKTPEDAWITFLQFDTSENLDRWLNSDERKSMLKEAEPLVSAFEYHHVSPYAGWFEEGYSVTKQTMLVLLVLYPMVMLEVRYLSPLTAHLNDAVAMFIANAITVTLISWPFLPLSIYFLDWWLKATNVRTHVLGALIVFALYAFLVFIFANI